MTMSLNVHRTIRMEAWKTDDGKIAWLSLYTEEEDDITIFMPWGVAEQTADAFNKSYTEWKTAREEETKAILAAHPLTALNEADDRDPEPLNRESYLPEFILVDKYPEATNSIPDLPKGTPTELPFDEPGNGGS